MIKNWDPELKWVKLEFIEYCIMKNLHSNYILHTNVVTFNVMEQPESWNVLPLSCIISVKPCIHIALASISYSYLYCTCIASLSLVFHRKDLCEARVNFKVCSYLADVPTLGQWTPCQSSMDLWKTTTPNKFHDRLTLPPPPIDHRSMEDHHTT